jgi:glycerol-3-phosphate O-acyltransferase
LLAVDRALTLDEVLTTVRPLADYIRARGWPVAGGATLTYRSTLRWALRELVRSGVLTSYSGGSETVWGIGEQLAACSNLPGTATCSSRAPPT